MATSDLAVEASRKALAQRGLEPSQIEAIIVGTVTPDMFFPSTACIVQNKLGAKGAWGFDLSAACSAFLYSVQVGAQFIASGAHKRVLAIGSDVMSSIIDYTDRATCVIFGDGAGAAILEPAENDSEGLIDFIHEVDGSGGQFLYMPGGGSLHPTSKETIAKKMHYVHQDGQQVFKFAVRKQTELCLKLLERNGLKGSDIDAFIPHQANLRIINATAETTGAASGKRGHEHRPLWQYYGGHHTAGHEHRHRRRQIEEGKSGAAGVCGGGVHGWGYAVAVGVLKAGGRRQASGRLFFFRSDGRDPKSL